MVLPSWGPWVSEHQSYMLPMFLQLLTAVWHVSLLTVLACWGCRNSPDPREQTPESQLLDYGSGQLSQGASGQMGRCCPSGPGRQRENEEMLRTEMRSREDQEMDFSTSFDLPSWEDLD